MQAATKIIHLCTDTIFNALITELFEEVAEGRNSYIIIGEESKEIKYKTDLLNYCSKDRYLALLKEHDIVIVHSFYGENVWAAAQVQQQPLFVSGWGGGLKFPFRKIAKIDPLSCYAPLTREYLGQYFPEEKKSWKHKLLEGFPSLNYWYYKQRTGEEHPRYLLHKAWSNTDCFSMILLSEREQLIKDYGDYVDKPFLWINYGYLQLFVNEFYGKTPPLGTGIFVGHSAFPSSNHLDVMAILKEQKVKDPIYLPLAYGKEHYKQKLLAAFEDWPKDQLTIQLDVLPKEEYVRQLLSCNKAIFGTQIQEAVGTLISCLYLGMSVYLNEKGFLYKSFAKWGFKVYKLDDIQQNITEERRIAEMHHNRAELEKIYGRKAVLQRIRELLAHLENLHRASKH